MLDSFLFFTGCANSEINETRSDQFDERKTTTAGLFAKPADDLWLSLDAVVWPPCVHLRSVRVALARFRCRYAYASQHLLHVTAGAARNRLLRD